MKTLIAFTIYCILRTLFADEKAISQYTQHSEYPKSGKKDLLLPLRKIGGNERIHSPLHVSTAEGIERTGFYRRMLAIRSKSAKDRYKRKNIKNRGRYKEDAERYPRLEKTFLPDNTAEEPSKEYHRNRVHRHKRHRYKKRSSHSRSKRISRKYIVDSNSDDSKHHYYKHVKSVSSKGIPKNVSFNKPDDNDNINTSTEGTDPIYEQNESENGDTVNNPNASNEDKNVPELDYYDSSKSVHSSSSHQHKNSKSKYMIGGKKNKRKRNKLHKKKNSESSVPVETKIVILHGENYDYNAINDGGTPNSNFIENVENIIKKYDKSNSISLNRDSAKSGTKFRYFNARDIEEYRAGRSTKKPAGAKPAKAKPAKAKPAKAKPAKAKPAKAKPDKAKPAGAKPAGTEPAGAKPAPDEKNEEDKCIFCPCLCIPHRFGHCCNGGYCSKCCSCNCCQCNKSRNIPSCNCGPCSNNNIRNCCYCNNCPCCCC